MVSINDGNLHRDCHIELANAHGYIRHLEAENGNLLDQNASLKAENERVGQANDELVQENLWLRKIIEDATRTAAEMQEILDNWGKTGEAK